MGTGGGAVAALARHGDGKGVRADRQGWELGGHLPGGVAPRSAPCPSLRPREPSPQTPGPGPPLGSRPPPRSGCVRIRSDGGRGRPPLSLSPGWASSVPGLSNPCDTPPTSYPPAGVSSQTWRQPVGALSANPSHPDPAPLLIHSLSPGVDGTLPLLPFLDWTTTDSLPLSPWGKALLPPPSFTFPFPSSQCVSSPKDDSPLLPSCSFI